MNTSSTQIQIFRSLFKGREDVFAIRWEKGGKSGYMPAYFYDPYRFRVHKMNGGSFQNYQDKSYLKLTEEQIQKHLDGEHHIGVYPLLEDNTSWFIVADFDKKDWQIQALEFIKLCEKHNIPAYLEKSRSGNGAHVWIFFNQPYPALKSRKIFLQLLEDCGAVSKLDKSGSFDRLFPNQDYLSGKGLGNLIALPLNKKCWEKGNNCFVHPETLEPIANQWEFLSKIEKLDIKKLDELYVNLFATQPLINTINNKLNIELNNQIVISKSALNSELIKFLKDELNFSNSAYFAQKNLGKSTYKTSSHYNLIAETNDEIYIPKGFIGKLLRFCKEKNIDFDFTDNRKLNDSVIFNFENTLLEYQKAAITKIEKKDFGIIVAPPGAGKTVIALKIVADKKQKALIVVHRKQLLNQWIERIENFLNIPQHKIGVIGQGKFKLGEQITVAIIQSLPKYIEEIKNEFGTIIVDECHHISAENYRSIINDLSCYYLYGITATPFRKNSDEKMIFIYLGDIFAEINPHEIKGFKHPEIIIRNTLFDIPYNSKTDELEILSKILVHDTHRNKLIFEDVSKEVKERNKVLILTERVEHVNCLHFYFKKQFEVIAISGNDSDVSKKNKWKIIHDGAFEILITTGQYFGEGIDLNCITCLFLVYPFSFKGKLIQYIGRVQRSEYNPKIYDYRDEKISYLNQLFLKRNSYYRKINKLKNYFEEFEENRELEKTKLIEKQIRVNLESIEFNFGFVSFKNVLEEINQEVEFIIENDCIYPELEVLKSYFKKQIKSDFIKVDISLEIEENKIISKNASSKDMLNITQELIDKFNSDKINKIITSNGLQHKTLFDLEELNLNENLNILSDNLIPYLDTNKYIHAQQVQFLASLHQNEIIKIRCMFQPFSFVFLIKGQHHYFVVLETLDTEEATYLFQLSNNISQDLILTDKHLHKIKNKGRQEFLKNEPDNFIRIFHDYKESQN
ncbi:MAG: hypothetical protein RLZZ414_1303, partial [Bacteroidota bacterium]